MGRSNANARPRERIPKLKARPNFRIEVRIADKPYKVSGDIRPGWIVAEGRVVIERHEPGEERDC